jgi:hypothetical protein
MTGDPCSLVLLTLQFFEGYTANVGGEDVVLAVDDQAGVIAPERVRILSLLLGVKHAIDDSAFLKVQGNLPSAWRISAAEAGSAP